MVENIHMKQRTMGLTFVLKSREAKGRRIESQFKNTIMSFQEMPPVMAARLFLESLTCLR